MADVKTAMADGNTVTGRPPIMSTTPLRFGIKFVIGFVVLMGAFEISRGSAFERFLVEDLILKPTTHLINVVTPEEHVELVGRTLTSRGANLASRGANLRVTRGCEGIEMFLLLIAAILAFPASFKHRAQGLLVGAILAYLLSVTRLMALHYILRYSPAAWEALHGLILPLGPIVLIALYFLRWSSTSLPIQTPDPSLHGA
jgi:exosortase family protein XrtM